MLKTIQAHPVLSKLPFPANFDQTDFYGINEKEVELHASGFLVINSEAILKIFNNRYKARVTPVIQILISSDYNFLASLPKDNPFYIPTNPFTFEFIIEMLEEANYFSRRELALCLLSFIEPYLKETIASGKSIFDFQLLEAMQLASTYRQDLVYPWLQRDLDKFIIDEETYSSNKKAYRILCDMLLEIAGSSTCFNFAATHLLKFASQELDFESGLVDARALQRFKELFKNAGVRTDVSLRERQQLLQTYINNANKNSSTVEIRILLVTLSECADVFNTGIHDTPIDPDYERYIHFAVDTVVEFTVTRDQVVKEVAQNLLHEVLKNSISDIYLCGLVDIPFRIYTSYVINKHIWTTDPLDHLRCFQMDIIAQRNDAKPSYDKKEIDKLELRVEQLNSIFSSREFIADDFILFLGAKNPQKSCIIDEMKDEHSLLSLHERQSLAERLIVSETSNIHEIKNFKPKFTYVIADFGLVISDVPHTLGSNHKRVFKSIPIKVPNYTVFGNPINSRRHAEEALYNYLADHVDVLIVEFKNRFGINTFDHKIYAVVLDLHGTFDMCMSCLKKGRNFRNFFAERYLIS